jgi:hypothetical protein
VDKDVVARLRGTPDISSKMEASKNPVSCGGLRPNRRDRLVAADIGLDLTPNWALAGG